MMPGQLLHRLAARICTAKSLERVIEPAIADLQREYVEAKNTDIRRRTGILFTGYAAILRAIVMCTIDMRASQDEERSTLVRVLGWSASMIVMVLALLILPPMYNQAHLGWFAAATLIPQAVPLAVPIGIAFGIAVGLTARPAKNVARVMLLGALAASFLSLVVLIWGIPAANQAFREISFRELRARGYSAPGPRLPKGYSEMTVSELRTQIAQASAGGQLRAARETTFRLHLRVSFAAATLALVTFLIATSLAHRGLRSLLAVGACAAYWALMVTGEWGTRHGYLPPLLGAWLPNLTLFGSAIFGSASVVKPPDRH